MDHYIVCCMDYLCTSLCLAPGEGAQAYSTPGYLTQYLLLWVGNRKRFDKTQNPKGGDVWQCCERAWKLQSSSKVLERLLLFTSFSTSPNPPNPHPNVEQNALILMAQTGSVPSVL